jgi:hypothetical protein
MHLANTQRIFPNNGRYVDPSSLLVLQNPRIPQFDPMLAQAMARMNGA